MTDNKQPTKDNNEALNEEEVLEEVVEPQESEMDVLKNKTTDLEKVVNDLNNKVLRALADNDNLRKRSKEELEKSSKYAISNFASELVMIVENFYLAEQNMPKEEIAKNEAIKGFAEAVTMTKKELIKVFEKNGITRLNPIGEKFNHDYHQAIAKIETEDAAKDGLVAKVIQAGYSIGDRLIRPALVKVFSGKN